VTTQYVAQDSKSMTDSTIHIKRGDAVYTIPADRVVEIIIKEGEFVAYPERSARPKTRRGKERDDSLP
jgi:hypothetical protein